jgi:CHAD domain-containing protein
MAEGKWIPELKPHTPLHEAACTALAVRLKVVGNYLPLAVHEPYKDPEHVHQLRVGTRRAVAALDLFSLCLPKKEYRWARKQLRGIRRAAGSARDWDVFLITLHSRKPRRNPSTFLLGYVRGQRDAAQAQLVDAAADLPDFDTVTEEIVGALQPTGPSEPHVLRELAAPMLQDLLKKLHDAAETDLHDYEHLHQVRILGKELRYAMELFAECYAEPFREVLYPAVEEMQDILGRANDSHVAQGWLGALKDTIRKAQHQDWHQLKPEIESVLSFHKRRLPLERKRFQEWWEKWKALKPEDKLSTFLKR